MFYDFICPECDRQETIEMRITEYKAEGHKCPTCNTEMRRDPKSLVCSASIDKTGTFYRRCN